MSLFYFVEILNHSGDVQARHKCSELPIRVGRSYSNDIILDDPHTAAEHAVIELNADGKLRLRDLGSQNGLKLKGKVHAHAELDGDTIVQLGRTLIRVRDSQYLVSPEVSDSSHKHWQTWLMFGCAIVMICALSLSTSWLGDIANNKVSDYIMDMTKWLMSAAAWAGIWALANRVFSGSANFGRHLLIFSCGIVALDLLDHFYSVLGFSFSWEWFTHYQSHLQIVIVAITIYFHLRLINNKRAMLKVICAALAVLSSGLILMGNYQSTNQYADNLYMSEVLPPAARISRNHSLAEFDQSIQQLKADIDAERTKALKEKAEKNNTNKP
jgi:FHA domain